MIAGCSRLSPWRCRARTARLLLGLSSQRRLVIAERNRLCDTYIMPVDPRPNLRSTPHHVVQPCLLQYWSPCNICALPRY
ncbi:hypothetical protein DFH09DRAFT_1371229 [Mycena vulgaris]|nr:hypothetical protein DFH09DRAFT_1371229 [Mycena vulgaris]